MVSTTAAATTRTVSISPVQGVVRREPGQSFHQNAIMATAGSANVEIGPRISSEVSVLPVPRARAKKTTAASSRPPSAEPGLRGEALALQVGERRRCSCGGVVSAAGWQRSAAAQRLADGLDRPVTRGWLLAVAPRSAQVRQQVLDGDGQFADPVAGGVEDRVGDRGAGADLPDLADALDAERPGDVVLAPR